MPDFSANQWTNWFLHDRDSVTKESILTLNTLNISIYVVFLVKSDL